MNAAGHGGGAAKGASITAPDLPGTDATSHLHTLALQNAVNSVIITDAAGVIEWVNPAFTALTGYTAAEAIGQNPRILKSGRHNAAFYRELWRTLRAGRTWRGEFINRRKNGTHFHGEQIIAPVRDASGRITHFIGINNDITQRKKLEGRVTVSEEGLRAFFSSATAGMAVLNPDLRYVQINATLADMNGASVQDHLGRTLEETVPDLAPTLLPLAQRVLQTGERILNVEIAGETPRLPGVRRHWIDSFFPLRGGTGRTEGVGLIAVEITERKQAEEKYREAERRFRELLENVGLIAMTLDAQGTVTFCNDFLAGVTGWSREEIVGSDWFARFIPSGRPDVKRLFLERIAQGDFPLRFENPILTKGGELREIVWHNTPLRSLTGDIVGTASIGEDVTDRRRAEELRRATDERVAAIFHSSPLAIAYGTPGGRLLDVNEQFAELLGYRREEMVGRTVQELQMWPNPDDRAPVIERLQRDGMILNHEVKLRRKTGETRTVLLSFRMLHFADEPVFLAMVVDVTAEKALEAQLHRAERVQSIGRLASGIAHDMNNILAPIMMSVALLRMPMEAGDVEKTLSTIELSAERGASLVKQLLTFGRSVEGERSSVSAGVLLRDIGKIAGETFPKNVEIVMDVAEDLWPVFGDASQLNQILLNLCVNARDAMTGPGRLLLSARNACLDESYASMHPDRKPGNYVHLAVEDTGTGIAPEIVDRVFEPFFTTKEVGQGTGLGLSLVASVVKAHGGFVTLRTAVGQGTTFDVFLPATPHAVPPASPHQAPPAPLGNGELILIVDDEASVRTVLQDALVRHRYRTVTAPDGAEALVAFARAAEEIKMVITDLDMPILDGANLVRALRRIRPGLPIVVSTGLGTQSGPEKSQRELAELGLTTVLAKPYTAERLLTVIHDTLHHTAS